MSDPHKVGDGMSSFVAYRITTRTNRLQLFRKFGNGVGTELHFCVNRRFSDFLGLHEKLSDKHLPKGRVIPPAPEKSVISSTRIRISGSNGSAANSDSAGQSGDANVNSNSSEQVFFKILLFFT